jgi:DNA-binding beta-propeller fold protein YncE
MKSFSALLAASLAGAVAATTATTAPTAPAEQRRLYVASPGIRNYVEWGGKGVLVYDIGHGHAFVKRIPSPFDDPGGKVENIKGVCASAATRRLYVTTLTRLACIDLVTEKPIWVKALEGGCDRMSITPDGKVLYVPSLEGPHWNVVDGITGAVIRKLTTGTGAHNTLCLPSGRRVFMADLKSSTLLVGDPATHELVEHVGPFSAPIRPYTVNGAGTLAFVNVNGLLGFEVGDVRAGNRLARVEVPGYKQGPLKRHGCPSHGVGLTPDEKELWVVDGANQRIHVFDATVMPPAYVASIELLVDQPGWITFSLDGAYAYPSTGEVIDTKTRKIVAHLTDEQGRQVQSEKLLEIDFAGGVPVRAGDQFGVGRVTAPATRRP